MAASSYNDTPGFTHGIVSQVTSEKLCALMKGANIKKKTMPKGWIENDTLDHICSPEDPKRVRSFKIEFMSVPLIADPRVASYKGESAHDLVELSNCHFYGTSVTDQAVDITIIIASSSTYEEEGMIDLNPKMLLLRFHRLMKSPCPTNLLKKYFD